MFTQQRVRHLTALVIVLLLALSQSAYGVQDQTDEQKQQEKAAKKQQEKEAKEQQKNEAKKDDKKALPEGTPVLWKDPGDISARDLFLGPGGEEMKPDLSSITFVERQTGGWSPKYRVRDGSGKTWVAKFGSEAQPETASMRIVWAMGYVTEINYLYPCVHIKGAPPPDKKVERCEGDGFANVRFEARPEGVKRLTEWEWSNNPFVGTKELKGLIIIMGLLNNWDLKTPNNKIIQVKDEATGTTELQYIISDLGATFGKTGGFISHNRNKPDTYAKTSFVKGVSGNLVKFAYGGKSGSLFDNITVDDARWIGGMLARLTDKQLNDAFRAANYDQSDIQLLTSAVRGKINELVNIQGGSAASTR